MKKTASMLALVGLFLFSGVILFQLQVAFGWTNPGGPPPTGNGLITALNNRVGILTNTPSTTLTVSGTLSVAGNLIKDVATPVAGKDAANKDYVDAQVGGGGQLVTVYGMSLPATSTNAYAYFNQTTLANFSTCLIGDYENCPSAQIFASGVFSGYPAAGSGVSCPTGYASIFDGYGPYAYIERNLYFPNGLPPTVNDGNPVAGGTSPDGTLIPSFSISPRNRTITYSNCGASYWLVAKTDYTILEGGGSPYGPNTGTGAAAGIASACIPQQVAGTKFYICNTCRICEKQ